MVYRFGHFKLDTQACELYRDGKLRKVKILALKILIYLIENRDRFVSRDEIISQVWGEEQHVSDATFSNYILEMRKIVGDNAKTPHTIRTRWAGGYRFVANLSKEEHSPMNVDMEYIADAVNAIFLRLQECLSDIDALRQQANPGQKQRIKDNNGVYLSS